MARKRTQTKQAKTSSAYFAEQFVRILIYLLFFLTPLVVFSGVFYDVALFPKYLVSQTLIAITAVCLSISLFLGRINLRKWLIAIHPILILFGILLISTLFSRELGLCIRSLPPMIFFLLFSIVCATYIKNPKEIRNILYVIIASAMINTIYGIFQYHGLDPLKWYSTADIGRVAGFLGNATWYGSLLVSSAVICLAFSLGFIKSRFVGIAAIMGFVLTCFAILLSGTRSSFVSISITVLCMIIILYRRKKGITGGIKLSKKQILVIISIIIVISLLIGGLTGVSHVRGNYGKLISRIVDVYSPESLSVRLRLLIWYTTASMIKDNFFFGVGWGCFPSQFNQYKIPVINNPDNSGFLEIVSSEPDTVLLNVHNEYLHFWAEAGVFFFIAFAYLIMIALLLSFRRSVEEETGTGDDNYRIISGFCILAFLVDSMFAFPLHLPANGLYFWGFIGIILSSGPKEYDEKEREEAVWPSWTKFAAGIPLLVIIAAFSYIGVKNMRAANAFYKGFLSYEASLMTEDSSRKAPLLLKAAEDLDRANEINPYDGAIVKTRAKVYMTLGEEYQKLGRPEDSRESDKKAIADFRRATELTNDKQIYLDLSSLYGRNGAYKNAEQYAQMAVQVYPRYPMAQYNLAKVGLINGEYDIAREALKKALQTDPDNPEYYLRMAVLLEENFNEYEMAVQHYQAYLALPDIPVEESRKIEKKIVDLKAKKLMLQAREAEKKGDHNNILIAKNHLEAALKLKPEDKDVLYELGKLKEEKLGDLFNILTSAYQYEKFLQLASPDDPRTEEVKAKIEHISLIRKLNDAYKKADSYFFRKEYEEGIKILESLLPPDPVFTKIYCRLGQIYNRHMNNDEKALMYFNEFLKHAAPDDPLRDYVKLEINHIQSSGMENNQ